ncbi:MAG: aminoacyl-tRNA hydrolase [Lachnospiraceae bacterium]|nr:aminoacyl-tRNA hydrolase [Lachnospiraceae bacterium]
MILIAGLGNPTMEYSHTRHNAGFDAIDEIAKENNIKMKKSEQGAITGSGFIGSEKVLLAKPQTFMNNSGRSVGALASYYKLDPASEIIIISDEIALPPGMIRIRKKGSAGGHNGLKSIISHLGTESFIRIRVGVGDAKDHAEMVSHVLGHFNRSDKKLMKEAYAKCADAIRLIVNGQIDNAMNLYNKKQPDGE